MMIKRLLLFNLMMDADDPVLGFAMTWVNALARRVDAVDVVTMQAGRLAVDANVRVWSLGKEKGYSEPRRAVEFYRILGQLLRKGKYDACFAHMNPLFAVMGAPLLKPARVPMTLWYAHGATPTMLKVAEKLVDHVVTSSAQGFRLPSKKVQIIGQGIDTDLFAPTMATERPFTLVTAGRIAPVKRLETMISAVRVLKDEMGIDARLRIVGGAQAEQVEYEVKLRALVDAYGLSKSVTFVGPVEYAQIPAEYGLADVMVNMSKTGSLDKAVLEAMACGLPVVTANEAFQGMLSTWGDLLYVPPDSPEVLPKKLAALAGMTGDERPDLGMKLRQIVVDEHGLERLVTRLLGVMRYEV